MTYERLTCLRFPEWKSQNGRTANDELDLGHTGYISHVQSGGCWSFVGNLQNSGQSMSCCGGSACVHEYGHSLGFYHEQKTPDAARSWMMRLNPENIQTNYLGQYAPPMTAWSMTSMVGYDI